MRIRNREVGDIIATEEQLLLVDGILAACKKLEKRCAFVGMLG